MKEEWDREKDKETFSLIDNYILFNDISFYYSTSCDIYDIVHNKTKIRFKIFKNDSYS